MHTKSSRKRWLRKKQLRKRYGDVTDKTIERAVRDKRIPPPEYPLDNKIPFWDEENLEAHERAVTMKRAVT
jgi:hypothetical protein